MGHLKFWIPPFEMAFPINQSQICLVKLSQIISILVQSTGIVLLQGRQTTSSQRCHVTDRDFPPLLNQAWPLPARGTFGPRAGSFDSPVLLELLLQRQFFMCPLWRPALENCGFPSRRFLRKLEIPKIVRNSSKIWRSWHLCPILLEWHTTNKATNCTIRNVASNLYR